MDPEKISHYRILDQLGAGGMGVVYLAEDLKLGRKVAIKVLGQEFTTNKDRLHRFELEAMQSIFIGGEFLAEDLDRDFATEFQIFGQIDHTHPAGAELIENSVT